MSNVFVSRYLGMILKKKHPPYFEKGNEIKLQFKFT